MVVNKKKLDMLYRKVPKNGDRLSVLGFGAMRLPVNEDESINEETAIAQIRKAIDKGVNYVDTAWPYHGGQSEVVVGKALRDGCREKVRIADKLPPWAVNSREDMHRILDKQLEKLGVETIDYYLLHALEGSSRDRLHAQGVTDFLEHVRRATGENAIRLCRLEWRGQRQQIPSVTVCGMRRVHGALPPAYRDPRKTQGSGGIL